ncbi:MAG: basic amino acid ABC transporter substrate-binding protein [Spirochaetota bacterium]
MRTIVVASDCTWPPMEMVDEDKNLVGYDIDLIKAVAEKGGFDVEIQNTAWDGIFAGLANGEYDAVISSVPITDKRKKTMDFSYPYINAGQVIVVQKSTDRIESLEDLKGKTVGAQTGTMGDIEVGKFPEITKKTYDEIGLAVEDLANGRIDAVVCDTPVAANYALQTEKYRGVFKVTGEPFTDEYYGIAVKKGNTDVLELINNGLKQVREEGINRKLENKWLR